LQGQKGEQVQKICWLFNFGFFGFFGITTLWRNIKMALHLMLETYLILGKFWQDLLT
jgi:hypothetical protein